MKKLEFLQTKGTKIVNESGKEVTLRGIALGGWLMMEGYMMCGRNIAEKAFKAEFARCAGDKVVEDFTKSFRDTFITETDIKNIKAFGGRAIRIPFNYKIVEKEDTPGVLNKEGISYLDRAIEWCGKNGIYAILDMHAVPGAQNIDWHSDCVPSEKGDNGTRFHRIGEPKFFTDKKNQDRYVRIWRFLADRYKDVSHVAGYDIMNEPVLERGKEHTRRKRVPAFPITPGIVKAIYERAVKAIREVDTKHIVFLEATNWGDDIEYLGKPFDNNSVYSIHLYGPPDFSFNWILDLHYPGKVHGQMWNKRKLDGIIKKYRVFAEEVKVPMYVGEFGTNFRAGYYGEFKWVDDMMSLYNRYGFHWTYWTYKTIANTAYPDGLYRYVANPPWINRKGPVTGWENFYTMWKTHKKDIVESWKTKYFPCNKILLGLLKKHL